jgi:hypothetical protein
VTMPRSTADYNEAKRKFNEQWLATGKGRPTSPAGPSIDMPQHRTYIWLGRAVSNCCSYYILAGALAFSATLLILAAGESTSHPNPDAVLLATPAAASFAVSTDCAFGRGLEPPAPFTSAITSAASTVNSAVSMATAHVKSACICKQGGDTAALLDFMADYVHSVNPKVDSERVATLLADAGAAGGVDPLLLLALARYESTFNIGDVNPRSHCRGLLQISPCHKRAMKRAGLNFYSERDRLAFACMMIDAQGLRPWTVRRRALALYEELRGEL